MDSTTIMNNVIEITERVKTELKALDRSATTKLFDNFVVPLKVKKTLRGKYKPSWDVDFVGSPMRDTFLKIAKKHNLHHYHFGHKQYRKGQDKKYPGDVSDAINHTRIEYYPKERITKHILLRIDLTHPSPFTFPYDRVNEISVATI